MAVTLLEAVGWFGTWGVLLAYASKQPAWFDKANALLWPLVIAPSIMAHVWNTAVITFTFGMIGTVHTVRAWRAKRLRNKWNGF